MDVTQIKARPIESGEVPNPFPGLRPFRPEDSEIYFGREEQIKEVLTRLIANRFVAVLGTSGVGKSSFAFCGLLPMLRNGYPTDYGSEWEFLSFSPGTYSPIRNMLKALGGDPGEKESLPEDPGNHTPGSIAEILDKLADRHRKSGSNLLIIIDQFEELFRFKKKGRNEAQETTRFIELILAVIGQTDFPAFVALTMRSDMVGDFAIYPNLTAAINKSQFLLPHMTRDQLKRAIIGPVELKGALISGDLVEKLLDDVGDSHDQLPILQHALMRTWDYWERNTDQQEPIHITHYEAVGGWDKSMNNHADEVFSQLGDKAKVICERIFKTVTNKSLDEQGARRPTPLFEVQKIVNAPMNAVKEVIEQFRKPGRTLLMPPYPVELDPQTTIDISHESLMRIWEQLVIWSDEEAESAKQYLKLADKAADHQNGKAYLLRPPELDLAVQWRDKQQPSLTWGLLYSSTYERTMEFLKASEKAELDRIERNKKLRRFALISALITAGIAIAAAVVLFFLGQTALVSLEQADAEKKKAVIASKEAEKQAELAFSASEEAKKERDLADSAKIVAQAAEEQALVAKDNANYQATRALQASEEAKREKDKADVARQEALDQKGVAEEAQQRAEARRIEALTLRNLSTARAMAVKSEEVGNDTLQALLTKQAYFSHINNAGDTLDPDIYDALYYSLKAIKGDRFNVLEGHNDAIRSVLFTDENKLYTASSDRQILRSEFQVDIGKEKSEELHSIEGIYSSMDIHPNGRGLISGTYEDAIFIYEEPQSAKYTLVKQGHNGSVIAIKSLNNNRIVSLGTDNRVLIWNLGQQESAMPEVLSDSSEIKLANTSIYLDQGEKFNNLGVSWNKKYLAICSSTGSIYVADLEQMIFLKRIHLPNSHFWSVAFSPDGQWLVAGDVDGQVSRWTTQDIANPQLESPPLIGHSTRVNEIRFSPDGKLLATASFDRTVRVWNWQKQKNLPIILKDHDTWVVTFAFSKDSKKIVTGCRDGVVKVWDTHIETMFNQIKGEPIARGLLTDDEWTTYVGDLELYDDTFVELINKP